MDKGAGFGGRNGDALYRVAFTRGYGFHVSIKGKAAHAADSTIEVADVNAVTSDIGFLNDDFTGGDDDRGMSDVGVLEAGASQFIARPVLVSHEVDVVLANVVAHDRVLHIEQLLPHNR